MNYGILTVAYVPIFIVTLLIFAAYNIILWPFTWMKLLIHKLIMIMVYSKSFRVSRGEKFMNFVFWLVVGLFILILNTCVDILFFIRHLWK